MACICETSDTPETRDRHMSELADRQHGHAGQLKHARQHICYPPNPSGTFWSRYFGGILDILCQKTCFYKEIQDPVVARWKLHHWSPSWKWDPVSESKLKSGTDHCEGHHCHSGAQSSTKAKRCTDLSVKLGLLSATHSSDESLFPVLCTHALTMH